jgi:hypothetical protein
MTAGIQAGKYHVGVHRYNRVWTWRTGQVMSDVPGTDWWGVRDPNENLDCADLAFDYSRIPELWDIPCSTTSWYVCALQ